MKKLKFCKDEETIIIDIPTLAQKGSECYYDTENSGSEDAYDSSTSDSEYFPSSSSDNESKSDTSDIFPSIPKIYPRTYNKKKIILRKICPRINFKNDDKDADLDVNKDEDFDVNKEDHLETILPHQSYGEKVADYSPSTPVYDEDEKDRFEKFNILLKLQNQNNSILDDNNKAEDYLYDKDEMTSDEIRTRLEDIFTSDEDI